MFAQANRLFVLLSLFVGAACPLPAFAGPTDIDPNALSRSQRDTPATRSVRPDTSTAGSNAIEILVELQDKTVGLEFKDQRNRSLEPGAQRGARVPALAIPAGTVEDNRPKSGVGGLYGSGAIPTAAQKRVGQEAEWRYGQAGETSAASNGAREDSPDDADARAQAGVSKDSEVIAWVGNNPQIMVIAAVGMLVLVCGISMSRSRRAR